MSAILKLCQLFALKENNVRKRPKNRPEKGTHDKVYLIGFGVLGGGGMAEARLRYGGGGGDRTQRSFITNK